MQAGGAFQSGLSLSNEKPVRSRQSPVQSKAQPPRQDDRQPWQYEQLQQIADLTRGSHRINKASASEKTSKTQARIQLRTVEMAT
jgi:hypothetical protein